jgi:nanoRNase/pAp phosphatase (c-di-AMP/oligoRNAs hydrolase)
MTKQRTKDNQRALIVKKIAEKHGVSTSFVYMVTNGTRENEAILSDYMESFEKVNDVFDNDLLKAVNHLLPFNTSKP